MNNLMRGVLASCLLLTAQAATAVTKDVLDLPAQASARILQAPLFDVGHAGQRLVAVGQRGHIIHSDDAGKTWRQARVPVSSDLVGVHFPTAGLGWAVGHDGVILHSRDGGLSWHKQLDGRQLGQRMQAFYSGEGATLADAGRWQQEAERFLAEGADKPFLDVWFRDAQHGYAVGAFNMIWATRDGGTSWQPQMHLADNPSGYHLIALAAVGDDLFVVGEQGLLLRLEAASGRFRAMPSPYEGSFFGATAVARPEGPPALLVYGLRGHAYLGSDRGSRWQPLSTGMPVGLTAAVQGKAGDLYLLSQAGHLFASADAGHSLQQRALPLRRAVSAAVQGSDGHLVLVGINGLHRISLPETRH